MPDDATPAPARSPDDDDNENLLNELVAAFDRFMVLPQGASETLALWVLLTATC